MNFSDFNLHPSINSGIAAQGYDTPTPIQAKAIPVVLQGGDVMGLAQTGTGKTAAFALPILERLMTGPKNRLRALVIAPTRELAEQINDVFKALGKDTGLRSHTVYGGVGMEPQVQRLRQGYEICVACPGRLLDHINQRTVNMSSLEVLVLDEADQMFDMGFFPTIRKILKHLPKERQSLFFSATMPEDIRSLANEVLYKPEVVQVDFRKPASTVTHAIYPIDAGSKTDLLFHLLGETGEGSVLVFTRTKHRAKRLARQLEAAGHSSTSLQGNLSQNKRLSALAGFRDGSYRIMVATDIAARGIDVSQVSHVINYDIPDTVEAYTHRIGRTGRAARNGDAFTLVTQEDESMVRAIERVLGTRIERKFVQGTLARVAPVAEETRDRRDGGRSRGSARNGESRNGAGRNVGGRNSSGRSGPGRNDSGRSPDRNGNHFGRSDSRNGEPRTPSGNRGDSRPAVSDGSQSRHFRDQGTQGRSGQERSFQGRESGSGGSNQSRSFRPRRDHRGGSSASRSTGPVSSRSAGSDRFPAAPRYRD